MEWKLFEGRSPEFASAEWYSDREAAHHIDEYGSQRERLQEAAVLVTDAVGHGAESLSDLGGGDGGFIQFLQTGLPDIAMWGYDLAPANVEFARQRGVDIRLVDFSNDTIEYGDVTVLTETLEHLENPHQALKDVKSQFIVASCPWSETGDYHYEFHLWAWDFDGYRELFEKTGWTVLKHYIEGMSQFVLAERL
jgi:hypothetical protein